MTTLDLFPLYLTFKVALVSTLLVFGVGLIIAYLLAKKDFGGKNLIDALIMQPLVIPPTVLGYYLLVVFGRFGPLGQFFEETFGIQIAFTWKGAVIAASVASLPLFVKASRAGLEGVEARFENAARLLGKSEWQVFYTITLPLAWKGIAAGTVMAFARAVGEFGATLMVAGNIPGKTQTISIAIYSAVQAGETAQANSLVLIVTLFSIAMLITANQLTKGRYLT